MAGAAISSTVIDKLTSVIAEKIFQEVKLVTGFKQDFEALCEELESVKSLLEGAGEKSNYRSMSTWILKLEDFVYDAMTIVEECREASQSRNPLFRSRNFRNPFFRYRVGRKIRILKEKIAKIHGSAKYVKYLGFSSVLDVNARVLYNPQDIRERSTSLLRESLAIGIEEALREIRRKILDKETQLIAVWGMGGQGKTHLLQRLFHEQRIQQSFDHVVWADVTQKFDSKKVLVHIAEKVELSINQKDGAGVEDTIREGLHKKKCLFVLDDVWQVDTFIQLDLPLDPKTSKIVITTRDIKVAHAMESKYGNNKKSFIYKKPGLSHEDSLKLFCIYAFPELPAEAAPPEHLKESVAAVVKKFGGNPLAIKARARSLCKVRLPKEWQRSVDGINGNALGDEVMSSLSLSYKALPCHLKACFLYCSSFPQSTNIKSEYLVYSWIAQDFICTQVAAEDAYELGCSYIDELVDRGLLEVSKVRGGRRPELCKMHDLFHQLALYESRKQSKCFIDGGQQLTTLPVEIHKDDWRRISLTTTDMLNVQEAISCLRLRTLILSYNYRLQSISPSFFNNLKYLSVLDLSNTAITTLPDSIKNFKNIKFLNLSHTNIDNLPESLSGLKRLEFLDVSKCQNLKNLHSKIGKNQFMLYLNMQDCPKLELFPVGISKLTCLQTLKGVCFKRSTSGNANALQLRDIKELARLEHLSAIYDEEMDPELTVGDEASLASSSMDGSFGGMTSMSTLSFTYKCDRVLPLPDDISRMQRLEIIHLDRCLVPKRIFEFQNLVELVLCADSASEDDYKGIEMIPNLMKLHLLDNDKCGKFPEDFGKCTAFPKLEDLMVQRFRHLESFPPVEDNAMPWLKRLEFVDCHKMKSMPTGLEKLGMLEEVKVRICLNDLQEAEHLRNQPCWQHFMDRKIKRQLKVRVKNPN